MWVTVAAWGSPVSLPPLPQPEGGCGPGAALRPGCTHLVRAVAAQAAAEVVKAPAEGPAPVRRQQHLVRLHGQDGLLRRNNVADGSFGGFRA